jgi:hypothetical protein
VDPVHGASLALHLADAGHREPLTFTSSLAPQPAHVTAGTACITFGKIPSRWRAKCFRPREVDTIDYIAHPAHMLRVTAATRRR